MYLPFKIDVKNGKIHGELSDGVEATDEDQTELLLAVGGAAPATEPPTRPAPPDHQGHGDADGDGEGEDVAEDGHGGDVGGHSVLVLGLTEAGPGQGRDGVVGGEQRPGQTQEAGQEGGQQGHQGRHPALLRVHIWLQEE